MTKTKTITAASITFDRPDRDFIWVMRAGERVGTIERIEIDAYEGHSSTIGGTARVWEVTVDDHKVETFPKLRDAKKHAKTLAAIAD